MSSSSFLPHIEHIPRMESQVSLISLGISFPLSAHRVLSLQSPFCSISVLRQQPRGSKNARHREADEEDADSAYCMADIDRLKWIHVRLMEEWRRARRSNPGSKKPARMNVADTEDDFALPPEPVFPVSRAPTRGFDGGGQFDFYNFNSPLLASLSRMNLGL